MGGDGWRCYWCSNGGAGEGRRKTRGAGREEGVIPRTGGNDGAGARASWGRREDRGRGKSGRDELNLERLSVGDRTTDQRREGLDHRVDAVELSVVWRSYFSFWQACSASFLRSKTRRAMRSSSSVAVASLTTKQ